MNNDIKPKITYKDHFLPTFLTDLIIKDSSMRIINIEEEKSELYYKTLNGYGKIIFKNNSEYDGFMKYGILESDERSCTFKFANGTEYKGELRQNQLTGFGEYSFPSGAIYKGEVKNGLRNGKGVYEYANEGLKYEGEWLNGLKHGKGILSVKDQMVYEGEFFEGIRQGFGKIEWVTKNIYEGYLYLCNNN
jgi:hypothetical protein